MVYRDILLWMVVLMVELELELELELVLESKLFELELELVSELVLVLGEIVEVAVMVVWDNVLMVVDIEVMAWGVVNVV